MTYHKFTVIFPWSDPSMFVTSYLLGPILIKFNIEPPLSPVPIHNDAKANRFRRYTISRKRYNNKKYIFRIYTNNTTKKIHQYAVNSCTQCTSSRYFCIYPEHVHKAHTYTQKLLNFRMKWNMQNGWYCSNVRGYTDSCNKHAKWKHAHCTRYIESNAFCNIQFTLHVWYNRTCKTETELPLWHSHIKLSHSYENICRYDIECNLHKLHFVQVSML